MGVETSPSPLKVHSALTSDHGDRLASASLGLSRALHFSSTLPYRQTARATAQVSDEHADDDETGGVDVEVRP